MSHPSKVQHNEAASPANTRGYAAETCGVGVVQWGIVPHDAPHGSPSEQANVGCESPRSSVGSEQPVSTRQVVRSSRTEGIIGGILAAMILVLIIGLLTTPRADAAPLSLERCATIRGVHDRRACIIRVVFGRNGDKAVRVAWCESRFDPNARNGVYRGVFQMGARERARYGHGRTVLAQALAARRYHREAGWAPWSCA